jgi:hypothetical protein
MIIVDTPYHVTFDELAELPEFACAGKCRKVWWGQMLKDYPAGKCPLCSGELCRAVEKVHFTVLARANRSLKLSDFQSVQKMDTKDKQTIKNLLAGKSVIHNLSMVKPAFVEKAKAEWC